MRTQLIVFFVLLNTWLCAGNLTHFMINLGDRKYVNFVNTDGNAFEVFNHCSSIGEEMLDITTEDVPKLFRMFKRRSLWIGSYNGDDYNNSCLTFDQSSVYPNDCLTEQVGLCSAEHVQIYNKVLKIIYDKEAECPAGYQLADFDIDEYTVNQIERWNFLHGVFNSALYMRNKFYVQPRVCFGDDCPGNDVYSVIFPAHFLYVNYGQPQLSKISGIICEKIDNQYLYYLDYR